MAIQLSDKDREAIIIDGDAALMVQRAEEVGSGLAKRLKRSQIRNIFGTVRQIQAAWPTTADEEKRQLAYRQLQLLKPKLAYQAARNEEVTPLAEILTPAIDDVGGHRERFVNFVDFFEAILAYHYSRGGRG